MSISSLPQTRSGRHVIPQLAWWTGERVTVDPIHRSIDIVPGTPNTQCASVPSDSYVSIALRYSASLDSCSSILSFNFSQFFHLNCGLLSSSYFCIATGSTAMCPAHFYHLAADGARHLFLCLLFSIDAHETVPLRKAM